MSTVYLPDVNLLVATFDSQHVHHAAAHRWWQSHRSQRWATCAITENGFVRVAVITTNVRPVRAAADLRQFQTSSGCHEFWNSGMSLLDDSIFDLGDMASGRHSTDIYLAGLAHAQGGRFVTFDQGVPWRAVRGATPELVEILHND